MSNHLENENDVFLEKDNQLRKFYKKEYDEFLFHNDILKNDNISFEELKNEYKQLHKSFYKSIKKMMKITNIGDSNQLKLIKAQETLREQEEKIRAVFDNAIIGLASADLNGSLLTGNLNLFEMLDFKPETENNVIVNCNIKDFITKKDDINLIEKYFSEIIDDRIDSFRITILLKKKDSEFWADFSVSTIYNTKKEPESLIITIANIDEEVKAKIELENSYKKLKNAQEEILILERKNTALAMAVTTNHEINQPLMIMKANLEMLSMTLPNNVKDEKIKKYITRIDDSVERINMILEKFRSSQEVEFEEYGGDTKMVSFRLNEDSEKDDFDF